MKLLKTNLLILGSLCITLSTAQATDYKCPTSTDFEWHAEPAGHDNYGQPEYNWVGTYHGEHAWQGNLPLTFRATRNTGHVIVSPNHISQHGQRIICYGRVTLDNEEVGGYGVWLSPPENHCDVDRAGFVAHCENRVEKKGAVRKK